jgi:hypothetical protein
LPQEEETVVPVEQEEEGTRISIDTVAKTKIPRPSGYRSQVVQPAAWLLFLF